MCRKVFVTLFTFIFIQDGDRRFVTSVGTALKDGNNTSSNIVKEGAGGNPPYDLRLSDLEPLEDQLAGHLYATHKVMEHPKLAMMKDSDGKILKPYITEREIDFYESVFTSEEETLKQMREFVPAYFGVKRILINENGKVINYLHLENLLKNYEMPCSMDVKIGLVRIPPGAPPRTREQEERYKITMVEWGFGIPGFSYYSVDGTKKKGNREFGYKMTLDQAIKTLYDFFQQEVGIKCKLVEVVIRELQKIYDLYEKQDHFLFYDTSILLTYDAKKIVDHFKKYSNYEQAISEFNCESDADTLPVRVSMIDFGKAVPTKGLRPVESREKHESSLRGDHENYLRGIRNLILLLEHLDEHVAARNLKSG